jgi:hypothetical protein
MGAGQVIAGACVSLTVTVNEHIAVLFEASVAVHDTVVTPFGKLAPDAGEHTTVQTCTPLGFWPGFSLPTLQGGQLSVTVGSANVTTAVQTFGSVLCVIGNGQVTVGGCVSPTVTVDTADAALEQPLMVTITV